VKGEAGEKADAVTAAGFQLRHGPFQCMRLAQYFSTLYGDLIGADDQVVRMAWYERPALCFGKSAHQLLG